MGTEGIICAVVDAGPLIHLAEVGALRLFRFFEELYLPGAVLKETVGQGRLSEEQILEMKNIQNVSVSEKQVKRFISRFRIEHLHGGEQECLYVCTQQKIDTILTDDLAVRDAAKRLKVLPVGSLGIVVRAYRRGSISMEKGRELIWKLYKSSSLFVTSAIVEMAIEQMKNG